MTKEQVIALCNKKEYELLNQYFGNLVKEAAVERPETIGEYTKDLPLKIEAEYRAFLEELWKEHAPDDLKGTPNVKYVEVDLLERVDGCVETHNLEQMDGGFPFAAYKGDDEWFGYG